jgi:hypothetical protein
LVIVPSFRLKVTFSRRLRWSHVAVFLGGRPASCERPRHRLVVGLGAALADLGEAIALVVERNVTVSFTVE